jgi:hypothetical protein
MNDIRIKGLADPVKLSEYGEILFCFAYYKMNFITEVEYLFIMDITRHDHQFKRITLLCPQPFHELDQASFFTPRGK